MEITKAVITAAKRSQRQLPLQTVNDREGAPRTALRILLSELEEAGIEQVAVVVAPGDESLYERAAGEYGVKLSFVAQEIPGGYGHAVLCAREFVGDSGFILMVSDHVFISDDPQRSCAAQLKEVAEAEQCGVSSVQATHESKLASFGAIGGSLFEGRRGLYTVDRVAEKPTPTYAEQELWVPGLRMGHYLCFLGIHALEPDIMEVLEARRAVLAEGQKLGLSESLDALARSRRYLAAELRGRRYDLEDQYGLLKAQLAIALAGPNREEVLAHLAGLLAEIA